MSRVPGPVRLTVAGAVLAVVLPAIAPAVRAQPTVADLAALVEGIRSDSMRANLEVLTGDRSIYIGDSVYTAEGGWLYNRTVRIPSRYWNLNDLPAHFIRERLDSYGLTTWLHEPAGYPGLTNVLARIEGATEPDRQILIGAHYDAVSGTPGADDNGSGTVAVMEIARLLSAMKPERSVVFGFWDAEEIGLVGSMLYAQEANTADDDIVAAINLDMIGWNSGEPVMLVATYGGWVSAWLQARLLQFAGSLNLPLDARSYSVGSSDHVSFAIQGYESVMLIEHYGGDFNPYYHTYQDAIEQVDFDYLTAITRLAAAGVASSAFDSLVSVGVEELPGVITSDIRPYPNPATDRVRFDVEGTVRIELFDVLGRRVTMGMGSVLDVSELRAGLYGYRLTAGRETTSGVLAVGH